MQGVLVIGNAVNLGVLRQSRLGHWNDALGAAVVSVFGDTFSSSVDCSNSNVIGRSGNNGSRIKVGADCGRWLGNVAIHLQILAAPACAGEVLHCARGEVANDLKLAYIRSKPSARERDSEVACRDGASSSFEGNLNCFVKGPRHKLRLNVCLHRRGIGIPRNAGRWRGAVVRRYLGASFEPGVWGREGKLSPGTRRPPRVKDGIDQVKVAGYANVVSCSNSRPSGMSVCSRVVGNGDGGRIEGRRHHDGLRLGPYVHHLQVLVTAIILVERSPNFVRLQHERLNLLTKLESARSGGATVLVLIFPVVDRGILGGRLQHPDGVILGRAEVLLGVKVNLVEVSSVGIGAPRAAAGDRVEPIRISRWLLPTQIQPVANFVA